MKKQQINKIGLLYISNKKLLVVHKPSIGLYITPGGKIELNESGHKCITREIHEELGCSVRNLVYFETFKGFNESNEPLRLKCYLGKLKGKIILNPNDSINDYIWVDKNWKQTNIKLAPILEYQIIPKLIRKGLIK